jgi:hypothetical protein
MRLPVVLCSVVETRQRLKGSNINGVTIEFPPECMVSEPQ